MGIIRRTKSVKNILAVFDHSHDAFSSVELVERFKEDMNKTTVYRVLDRLEDEGILHSFQDQKGLTWYARCSDCSKDNHHDVHPHFQCKDCGKTECLPVEIAVPKLPMHKVNRVELLMVGQCQNCLN
jgi:Fur family ferric uptake transcriptional regulator